MPRNWQRGGGSARPAHWSATSVWFPGRGRRLQHPAGRYSSLAASLVGAHAKHAERLVIDLAGGQQRERGQGDEANVAGEKLVALLDDLPYRGLPGAGLLGGEYDQVVVPARAGDGMAEFGGKQGLDLV